jgi:hypothetical protein
MDLRRAAMRDAGEIVKGLAEVLSDKLNDAQTEACLDSRLFDCAVVSLFERVLREAGLVEVLEAGQAMRDCNYINTANSMAWDAAVTRLAGEGSDNGRLE